MELYIIIDYACNVFLHRLKAIYLFSKRENSNLYYSKKKSFVTLLNKEVTCMHSFVVST